MLGVELLTKILSADCNNFPKELTGRFWSAVADLLSCRVQDDDEEDMSGQAMVGQAGPGTLASGDGTNSSDSQVGLGASNVHVDTIVLKEDSYMQVNCTHTHTSESSYPKTNMHVFKFEGSSTNHRLRFFWRIYRLGHRKRYLFYNINLYKKTAKQNGKKP